MIKQDSTSTILRNVGAFIAAFSFAVSYLGLPFCGLGTSFSPRTNLLADEKEDKNLATRCF